MDSGNGREAPQLKAATSSFVLAAAITILFSTALAWAKDFYAPLKSFLRSLTGQDWTTHGLVDLLLFIGLGLVFVKTKAADNMSPRHLIGGLVMAVGVAGVGLALWFAFI
jgi:multisubunit Na+/H+ antiporter MnhB subunit